MTEIQRMKKQNQLKKIQRGPKPPLNLFTEGRIDWFFVYLRSWFPRGRKNVPTLPGYLACIKYNMLNIL
jgi:hypothetical protein